MPLTKKGPASSACWLFVLAQSGAVAAGVAAGVGDDGSAAPVGGCFLAA